MDRADLLRWARDAGFMTGQMHLGDGSAGFDLVMPCVGSNCLVELQRFASRVAEEERDACARACEPFSAECVAAIQKRGTP